MNDILVEDVDSDKKVIACRTQVYGKGGQREGVIHANPP